MIVSLFSASCTESIPECPTRMCVIAGGWQLTGVLVDDATYDGDLSRYRLTLHMPSSPDATSSNFTRINVSDDLDEGFWSVENDDTILRLVPEGDPLLTEDWIIESMTPRKMVLIINRDTDIKSGPGKIELVLEPF